MTYLQTIAIFIAAAVAELSGVYAVWRWRRGGGPAFLTLVGLVALFVYALIQTYQPEARFGRVFAAYAGTFLVGAMLWGWLIDGHVPDRFDWVGAVIMVLGIATILWGRRLAA